MQPLLFFICRSLAEGQRRRCQDLMHPGQRTLYALLVGSSKVLLINHKAISRTPDIASIGRSDPAFGPPTLTTTDSPWSERRVCTSSGFKQTRSRQLQTPSLKD